MLVAHCEVQAKKMMAETEKKEADVKKLVAKKTVEAEISITNEGEMDALKSVEKAIDQNAEPCKDFAQYTCGRCLRPVHPFCSYGCSAVGPMRHKSHPTKANGHALSMK